MTPKITRVGVDRPANPDKHRRLVRVRTPDGVREEVVDPTTEQRFVAYFREVVDDEPGLILNAAGNVYLVAPDGTRTALAGGGGGGGLPPQWSQDNATGEVTASLVDASVERTMLTYQVPPDLEAAIYAFQLLDSDGNLISGLVDGEGTAFFIFSADGTFSSTLAPAHLEMHENGHGSFVYSGQDADLQVGRDSLVALHVDTHGQTTLGAIDADALASLLIKPTGEGIDQLALVVCQDGNRVVQIGPAGDTQIATTDGTVPLLVLTGPEGLSQPLLSALTFDGWGGGFDQAGQLSATVETGQHSLEAGNQSIFVTDGGIFVGAEGSSTLLSFYAVDPVGQQDATDGPSLVAALVAYGLLDSDSSWSGGGGGLPTGWTQDGDPANVDMQGGTLVGGEGAETGSSSTLIGLTDLATYQVGLSPVGFMVSSTIGAVTAQVDQGVISAPGVTNAFTADGSNGATVAFDAGGLTLIGLTDLTAADEQDMRLVSSPASGVRVHLSDPASFFDLKLSNGHAAFSVVDDGSGNAQIGFFATTPQPQQDATDGPSLVDALIAYGLLDSGSSWTGGGGGLALTGWTEDDSDPANVNTNGGVLFGDDGTNNFDIEPGVFGIESDTTEEHYFAQMGVGFVSVPGTDGTAYAANASGGGTVALDAGGLIIQNVSELLGDSALNVVGTYAVQITDVQALSGTGNGLMWLGTGIDGGQSLQLVLGDSAEFAHLWAADGTYTLPSGLVLGGDTVAMDAGTLPIINLQDPTNDEDAANKRWVLANSDVLPTGWSVNTPNAGDFFWQNSSAFVVFGPDATPDEPVLVFGGEDGSSLHMGATAGIQATPSSSTAYTASGSKGATVALDAGGLLVVGFQGLPTSDPGSLGALYTLAGALMVSAG